jgi:hypothetical protein
MAPPIGDLPKMGGLSNLQWGYKIGTNFFGHNGMSKQAKESRTDPMVSWELYGIMKIFRVRRISI